MKEVTPENKKMIGKIYTECQSQILAIFLQAQIPAHICEDLVQEVFIKVMEQDIIYVDMLKGLAVTIAYHKRADYLRRRAMIRRKGNSYDMQRNNVFESHAIEAKEIAAIEEHAIGKLSEADGRVYRMSRFDGKTKDEIAEIMHITGRAAESKLYRSRKIVRENVRKAIGI